MPDAGTAPRKRKRPPYRPNDRHNHGSNAAYVQIDWDKLAKDSALQAGMDGEDRGTDEHARSG